MTSSSIQLVSDARNGVGESPFWDAQSGSLFWVDIPARKVHRWRPDGGVSAWRADEMIGCIAPAACGGLIAGMESGVFHLDLQDDGSVVAQRLAPVEHADRPMRFNDGRCDRQGRFWAGTMHLDMGLGRVVGAVYRHDGRGLQKQLDGLIVPNGFAWSPDGRTMYLSDSHPAVQAVWAFDYDTDDGAISNRRRFIDMRHYSGRPDGAAVDVEGCYWICGNDAGLVHRFTPDGRLDRSVALPVKKPAMCAFGGPDMGTMFVTSIRPGDASVDTEQPLAGGVFSFEPGVKGLLETPFCF
jgi:sugar lactone lactonase YvrE